MVSGKCRARMEWTRGGFTMARMESVSSDRVLFWGGCELRICNLWGGRGRGRGEGQTMIHLPFRSLRVLEGGAAMSSKTFDSRSLVGI